ALPAVGLVLRQVQRRHCELSHQIPILVGRWSWRVHRTTRTCTQSCPLRLVCHVIHCISTGSSVHEVQGVQRVLFRGFKGSVGSEHSFGASVNPRTFRTAEQDPLNLL